MKGRAEQKAEPSLITNHRDLIFKFTQTYFASV